MVTRVGLIGAGNISTTHARAVEQIPGTQLVAVYNPTRQRADALAGSFGAAAYDALDEFFAGQAMDMVAIGTPSGLHAEHGMAATGRGVHVLVEKPIDIATARADALIASACRAGVTLGVIFQDRTKSSVRELKGVVDSGALGRIVMVRAAVPWWRPPEYYSQSRWRGTWTLDGGGALINQAIHTLDVVLWICGAVARVSGKIATQCHAIEVEDTAAGILEFASGAIGTIEATTCAYPGRPRRIEIIGTRATAVLDGDRLVSADRAAPTEPPPLNAASPVVADVSAHRDVFVDFIEAFRAGTKPLCDGVEARRSVAVIEAIYESSRTGKPVDLKGEYYS